MSCPVPQDVSTCDSSHRYLDAVMGISASCNFREEVESELVPVQKQGCLDDSCCTHGFAVPASMHNTELAKGS